MPVSDLAARVKQLRQSRKPTLSRKALGESFGFDGDSAYQAVYEWETGRRQLPASEVPKLAEILGVSICGLYGVEEGHQVPSPLTVAQQLAQALGVEPGRIEVNVYPVAEPFNPTAADRDTRDIVRAWDAMPESVQQEWLAFAAGIRHEKGEQ